MNEAMKVSALSVIVNAMLTLFKLFAGFIAHSAAMVSDAVHSASDVLSGIIVMIGVRVAAKAPDKSHPYGHERFECAAAIVLSTVLAIVGGMIGVEAVEGLLDGATEAVPGRLALVAAIVSILVKGVMFAVVRGQAGRIGSTALRAEAWHHLSDALSSIGALIGIAGARLGVPALEPVASLVICAFIEKAAVDIFRDAIDRMVDHACDEELEDALRRCILKQEGVRGIDLLKTRMFADKAYVDVEIEADGSLPLQEAHEIAERVHGAIEGEFSQVKHVMVHVNPADGGNSELRMSNE